MVISIIFWAVVLIIWFLTSQRSRYVNQGYRITERYRQILQEETSCLKMVELTELSLCELESDSTYLLEQVSEDLEKEMTTTMSQKLMKNVCKRIVHYSIELPKRPMTGLNICVIAKYIICYPLVTAFAISAFIAVWSYMYVRNYLSYLSISEHLLFYSIPLALFGIPMIISYRKRGEWHWPAAQKSFLIAFWLSFGISIFLYNWQDAKDEYEEEMEELFGEEWEEEVEEMEQERFYRR